MQAGSEGKESLPLAWLSFAGPQNLTDICVFQEHSALSDEFLPLLFFLLLILCCAAG